MQLESAVIVSPALSCPDNSSRAAEVVAESARRCLVRRLADPTVVAGLLLPVEPVGNAARGRGI